LSLTNHIEKKGRGKQGMTSNEQSNQERWRGIEIQTDKAARSRNNRKWKKLISQKTLQNSHDYSGRESGSGGDSGAMTGASGLSGSNPCSPPSSGGGCSGFSTTISKSPSRGGEMSAGASTPSRGSSSASR